MKTTTPYCLRDHRGTAFVCGIFLCLVSMTMASPDTVNDAQARKAETAKRDEERRSQETDRMQKEAEARRSKDSDKEGSFNKSESLNRSESLNKGSQDRDGQSGRMKPNPEAEGAHTSYKRDPETGKITKYETYREQTNPQDQRQFETVKRVDLQGDPHYNKATGKDVNTPHVHDRDAPGGVRPARPDEVPNR